MGIRSVRYFQWRRDHDGDNNYATANASTTAAAAADSSCIREEHALWACRGVALKCGSDLVRLRDCFRQHSAAELLSQTATAYETTTATATTTTTTSAQEEECEPPSKVPCATLQQSLGACVAKNAKALAERKKQWIN